MMLEYELFGVVLDIICELFDFFIGCVQCLQVLVCGDEGFFFVLGYLIQCGYGCNYLFVGEICIGVCEVWLEFEEFGFVVLVGEIEVIECEMVNQFVGFCEELL